MPSSLQISIESQRTPPLLARRDALHVTVLASSSRPKTISCVENFSIVSARSQTIRHIHISFILSIINHDCDHFTMVTPSPPPPGMALFPHRYLNAPLQIHIFQLSIVLEVRRLGECSRRVVPAVTSQIA